jgi:hypothetical protein
MANLPQLVTFPPLLPGRVRLPGSLSGKIMLNKMQDSGAVLVRSTFSPSKREERQ